MRALDRSVTYTRRVSGSTTTPCTASNVPGRVSFGGVPFCPHVVRNFPSLSNFTTRVLAYPSATYSVLSGSHVRNVGRLKCVESSPATPLTPNVCTSYLPSFVNL